ncbi:hypothetical protein [Halorarius litoreus]|uniref:hypothetical protein n=1 Tax=Halorarius litoreus TaxID=2962676 RepID=UPI0020CF2AC6|nr:hypothetical protein [Halorarius litoreus]
MVDPLTYFAVGSLLFVFWAYGVVSFALDVKRKFVPMGRQYLRGREEQKQQARKEQERDEREKQLL